MQPLECEAKACEAKRAPLICAHRGASGHAPENTMAAFRKALADGASWIEFDIHLSADGEVIVMHDETLERTTDMQTSRRCCELTLAQLKQLDAGSWFDKSFAGERIPTLDEVLTEFKGKLGMNVEIKSSPTYNLNDGIEQKVADLLARHGLHRIEDVIVNSFDPRRLQKFRACAPRVTLGAIYCPDDEEFPSPADARVLISLTAAQALHPDHKATDEAFMHIARQAGVMVNTWTVNDISDMQRMAALGVDMIMTDYPSRLQGLLRHI